MKQDVSQETQEKGWLIPIIWEGMEDAPEVPDMPVLVDIGVNAASAAVMSGLNAMMKEGGQSLEEWRSGKIDETQFTYRIIHKGTNAATKNGVRTGSALVLSEGAKRAITRIWGHAMLKRLTRYNTLTAVCFGLVDQTSHTIQLVQGKLDPRNYKVKSVENAGSTTGAIGGAAAGAIAGSIVPGLGTGTGAMMGYLFATLGAMSGGALGRSLGEKLFPSEDGDDNDTPSTPSNKIDIPIFGE